MLNIGIELPNDIVTQKCSIMGVTGTGKSNGTGVILEEFCKNGLPFVVIDISGAHWGIAEKYELVLIGGERGGYISPTHAKYYAQLVINNDRVILDVSKLHEYQIQEFVGEFLDELFELHSRIRTPRHIFVEEAEVVFPQQNFDSSRQSLLAGNKVMKRGRSVGLGMTLISQRPQDLNKKTLSQCQANFILHMEGIQEMEVIRKMLRSETSERRDQIIRNIESAQKGECLLYSPQWLRLSDMFKFRERETFHAGYTPELGVVVEEPKILLLKQIGQQQAVDTRESAAEKQSLKEIRVGVVLAILALIGIGLVMFQ